MSLIEAANLGFSEKEFLGIFGWVWKHAVFCQPDKNKLIEINRGQWKYFERREESEGYRAMQNHVSMAFRGNLVWNMDRRGSLSEYFLENYDVNTAKKIFNFRKQMPLHVKPEDLYSTKDGAVEIRLEGFKGIVYLLTGGRGETGDFNSDESALIELENSKSEILWTGGILGGIVLP